MGEDHSTAVEAPTNPPPPLRRPRVREVSSRFMTPVATSSSSFSPLPQQHQRSSSVQKQRRHLELDKDSSADNSTSSSVAACSPQRMHPQNHRAIVKLFKENANGERQESRSHHRRPDTPMVTAPPTSRLLPHHRSCNTAVAASTNLTHSTAAKLLHSSTGMSSSSSVNLSANLNCGPSEYSSGDSRSSNISRSNSARSLPDLRSSMPVRATVSSRLLTERNVNTLSRPDDDAASVSSDTTTSATTSSKFSASPCSRSLDLQRSSSENSSFFHSLRGSEKSAKQQLGHSLKIGGVALPPVPRTKVLTVANASRRGRKASGQQEDFHSLKMIHNRYLQWRYANAKAESSSQAQSREAEMKLYSLGCKISELNESVTKKRSELARLQQMATLATVLESQMPYLDEWITIEGEYKDSLSETTQALVNSSIQLPVGGNVTVDTRELAEALKTSGKLMESIASTIERFMAKAAETETLVSELARVNGGETARVQECGGLLSLMHKSQMEECSVRGQIIQFHRPVSNQKRTTA
ncbi:unnamed protein product [Linum tenue]|uniref:Uncharacterized protein n=1 Tax=Linum tenue TaxID=586396 RepID=A0AAV0M217_9ROSI|nr:unnamed protein product [Linum tenue]